MQDGYPTDPAASRAPDRTPSRGSGEDPAPAPSGTLLRAAACASAAFLGVGVMWDLAGRIVPVSPWWPAVSYSLIGLGAALACVAVLLRMLLRRGRAPRETRRMAVELLAIGVVLLAWSLRGHAEVVPDSPLVVAQAVAAMLLAAVALARRRARRGR
jgi:hypothetical protein